MTFSRFPHWLRADAWVDRCAAMLQRRRMRRAEALLPEWARAKATSWRALYLARNARLQREREARRRARNPAADATAQHISKADVLAAIARSRANREARMKDRGNG
jgi:hypothetical protein